MDHSPFVLLPPNQDNAQGGSAQNADSMGPIIVIPNLQDNPTSSQSSTTDIDPLTSVIALPTDLQLPEELQKEFGINQSSIDSMTITSEQPIARKRKYWTREEDDLLIKAVNKTSPLVWDLISKEVPGRTPIQCKERWLYRLDPSLNRKKFELWEDIFILMSLRKFGNQWKLIANRLPGRNAYAIKNRFYTHLYKFM